jgi:hypothetical protein
MEMAAFLPWAIESIIVPGPVTKSPPAKTPFNPVSRVTGSDTVPGSLQSLEYTGHRFGSGHADGKINGIKRLKKRLWRDIFSHFDLEPDLDSHLLDDGKISFDDLPGEPVRGKTVGEESAHFTP